MISALVTTSVVMVAACVGSSHAASSSISFTGTADDTVTMSFTDDSMLSWTFSASLTPESSTAGPVPTTGAPAAPPKPPTPDYFTTKTKAQGAGEDDSITLSFSEDTTMSATFSENVPPQTRTGHPEATADASVPATVAPKPPKPPYFRTNTKTQHPGDDDDLHMTFSQTLNPRHGATTTGAPPATTTGVPTATTTTSAPTVPTAAPAAPSVAPAAPQYFRTHTKTRHEYVAPVTAPPSPGIPSGNGALQGAGGGTNASSGHIGGAGGDTDEIFAALPGGASSFVGIMIGAVAFLIFVAAAVVLIRRRSRQDSGTPPDDNAAELLVCSSPAADKTDVAPSSLLRQVHKDNPLHTSSHRL